MIRLLILCLWAMSVLAGPIRDDYYKTKESIESQRSTPESRKAQLKKTLTESMSRALYRYYRYADYDKITLADGDYEQSELDPFTYYVKHKDFVGFFTYNNNPELYNSLPKEEKILLKPGASVQKLESTKPGDPPAK